jgi:drug/metabolite transporter (DMT)-like permease
MAALWMVVSGLCFTASGVFAQIAAERFNTIELALYRSLFIVVALLMLAWLRGQTLRTVHWRAHLARSAAGVASVLLFFYCLASASLATAVTLNYTSPLFLALITALVLRERIAPLSVAAIVVGFIGVVALLRPGAAAEPLLPGAAGLAGGAVAAVAYLGIRHLGAAGEPEWRTVFYFALLGLITCLLLLPFSGASSVRSSDLPVLAGIGLFALGAQMSMTLAYSRGQTLVAGTLSYSGVLFAGLFDLLAWQQSPPLIGWIGMALIVAAGVMTVLARRTPDALKATLGAKTVS